MIPERERSIDGKLCWTLRPQIEWMKNAICLVAFKKTLTHSDLSDFHVCSAKGEAVTVMESVSGHWCWFKTTVRLCLWNLYIFCHVVGSISQTATAELELFSYILMPKKPQNNKNVLFDCIALVLKKAYMAVACRGSARNVWLPDTITIYNPRRVTGPLSRSGPSESFRVFLLKLFPLATSWIPLILDTKIAICWLLDCYCYWNTLYSA